MTGQPEAEAGVRAIAASLGKEVSTDQVQALAAAFLGVVACATNAAWRRAAAAGESAAAGVVTVDDAVRELGR